MIESKYTGEYSRDISKPELGSDGGREISNVRESKVDIVIHKSQSDKDEQSRTNKASSRTQIEESNNSKALNHLQKPTIAIKHQYYGGKQTKLFDRLKLGGGSLDDIDRGQESQTVAIRDREETIKQLNVDGKILHQEAFHANSFGNSKEEQSGYKALNPVQGKLRQRPVVHLPKAREIMKVNIDMESIHDVAMVKVVMKTDNKVLEVEKERFLPVLQALMDTLENLDKDDSNYEDTGNSRQ